MASPPVDASPPSASPALAPSAPAPRRWDSDLAFTLERLWLPAAGLPLDAVLVSAAFASSYWLRFHCAPLVALFPIPGGAPLSWLHYRDLLLSLVPVWLAIFFHASRLYEDPYLPTEDRAVRVLSGCFQGTLATLALSFLYRRFSDSRLMGLLMFPTTALYVMGGHVLLGALHRGVFGLWSGRLRLLLVGGGRTAELVRRRLSRSSHREVIRTASLDAGGILRLVRDKGAHEVILTQSSFSRDELVELAETLEASGVRLRIVPSLLELRMGEVQIDQSLGLPMLRLHHVSLSGSNFVLKRVFDLCFGAAVAVFGALPFAFIALLIKLDSPGPVLYKQKRFGFKGRVFDAYKFRTMGSDAESQVQAVKAAEGSQSAFFKAKTDPRVTRVGRWLRRLSLDEFPQFLNVLKGEMSVVGPRPLALSTGEMETLEAHYGATARKMLNVLPGITGLWQVSGRSEIQGDERFALEIYYIEHWSLGLDLKIILKTLPAMVSTRGAY